MIALTTVGSVTQSATVPASWEWMTPRRFGIALALIIVAIFPEVILGRQTFAFRDFSIFGYPVAFYHKECFWRGEMPLWNPLNSFGVPFVAQWNTMTLYPLSLIYLLLPLPWSLNLFCLIHLFVGGMGMFYLTSRWTGCRLAAAGAGFGYAFCGLLSIALIWPNILAVLCWLPWVLYSVERGLKEGGLRLWVAVLVGALQMLAGMPEYTLLTWILAGGLWVIQQPTWAGFRRLVCLLLAVTALIAAQLLPFLELLLESQRHTMFEASARPLPLWGWANFFVPLFHTRVAPQGVYFPSEQPLFTSYYVALPLVILAAYALIFGRDRRIWFFGVTALVGFWLALGNAGYLYKWLLHLSPVFGSMRYPVKFLAFTVVALPILAAFGLAHWTSGSAQSTRHRRALLLLAVGCAAIIVGIMLYAHLRPLPSHDGPPVWWNGLWRLLFLISGAGLLLGLKHAFQNQRAHLYCSILLLGCIVLDCLTHVPKHDPTALPTVYVPGVLAARIESPPQPGEGRAFMSRPTHDFLYSNMLPDTFDDLMGRRLSLFGNLNLLDHVATPDGFYAMYLPAARQIWHNLFFAPPERFAAPLADFAAITHMTGTTNIFEWVKRPHAMPMVSAGQAPRFRDEKTNLLGVLHKLFDPRTIVYLPNEAKEFVIVTNTTNAKIITQRFGAHRIEAEVEASEPSLVVVSQAYYRPWQAFVDGVRTRIFRANYAFQALQVPAGRHKVELVYNDSFFKLGVIISLATLPVFLFCVYTAWRQRPRST